MSAPMDPLHGSCACERNQYSIQLPASLTTLQSEAQIFFSNSLANRKSQATPLTAWLRIPITWYASHTRAFFPDETHARIRRVYEAEPAGRTRRLFCGFCGTHLSAWSEAQERVGKEEVLDVTLGSLEGGSLARLQELGLWEEEEADEEEGETGLVRGGSVTVEDHVDVGDAEMKDGVSSRRARAAHDMIGRGVPGFEEMIESSRLGRIRRKMGAHGSRDGGVRVEWEVVEIEGNGEEGEGEGEGESQDRAHKKMKMDVS